MFIIQPTSVEVEDGWDHRDGLYIDGKRGFGGWIHCFAKQERDELTRLLLSWKDGLESGGGPLADKSYAAAGRA